MVTIEKKAEPDTETGTSAAAIWGDVAVFSIAILFVGMPLVFGGLVTYDMFDLPKVVFMREMSLIILAAWIIKTLSSGAVSWRRTPLDLPILAFGFAGLLSTIHSLSPNLSVHGEYRRYEGIYTIINYILLYFLVANLVRWTSSRSASGDTEVRPTKDLSSMTSLELLVILGRRIVRSQTRQVSKMDFFGILLLLQVVAGALVALYGIFQHFGKDFILYNPHGPIPVVSTFGNTNFLAAYLVMVIPIAVSLFLETESIAKRLFLCSCTLTMTLGLFYTSSRGAWLGLIVAMTFFFLIVGKKVLGRNRAWLIVVALLLIAPPLANFDFVRGRVESIFGGGQTTVAYRFQWWQSLVPVIRDNPILGTGISTLEIAYPKYATLAYAQAEGKDTFLDKAHNEFVHLAVTEGLVGLGAYIWILAALGLFFVECWRRQRFRHSASAPTVEVESEGGGQPSNNPADHLERRWLYLCGLMGGVIAYLVQNQFSFGVIGISSLFWMMIGFIVVLGTPDKEIKTAEYHFNLSQNWSFVLSLGVAVVIAVILTQAWRPFTADQMYRDAQIQFSDGKLDKAIETYKSVLGLNPYQTEYWRGLASTYAEKAKGTPPGLAAPNDAVRARWLDQAVEAFTKASELNPAPFHYFFLGETQQAYQTDKGLLEAYQSYKTAVYYYPYYLYANRALGEVAYQLRIFDESARAFQTTALLDPQDVRAQTFLAFNYIHMGKDDEQAAAWQRVLELDPGHYPAHYYLGALAEKRGKISDAIKNYQAYMQVKPKPEDQADYARQKLQVEDALKRLTGQS